ncbi:probable G-protein coupled receptor frpr-1 [Haliotis cracherodii]|uniref:probable G-protein coupled receptor frpr-1 n=1 Tax=Haliotis cracherodii TaxID=6455 RepID=UPI0039EB6D64
MANISRTEIRYDDSNDLNLNSQQFGHETIAWIATVIAICGVFGNILGAVVLHRMQKTNSGVRLLKYLSLVDVILLVLVFLSSILLLFNTHVARTVCAIFHPFAYLLAMALYTFEIYLTVLIAVQRCTAVTFPFKSGFFLRVINKVLGAVAVFTVAFNVPLWLTFWPRPYWNPDLNMQLFYQDQQGGFLGIDGFKVYIGFVLVFRCVIPLTILITCNIILTISSRRQNSGNGQTWNKGFTALVVAITTMSVVTHDVSAVDLLLWVIDSSTTNTDFQNVVVLLITINCSTNFIFYYSFGKIFRQNFKSFFKVVLNVCCKENNEEENTDLTSC